MTLSVRSRSAHWAVTGRILTSTAPSPCRRAWMHLSGRSGEPEGMPAGDRVTFATVNPEADLAHDAVKLG